MRSNEKLLDIIGENKKEGFVFFETFKDSQGITYKQYYRIVSVLPNKLIIESLKMKWHPGIIAHPTFEIKLEDK